MKIIFLIPVFVILHSKHVFVDSFDCCNLCDFECLVTYMEKTGVIIDFGIAGLELVTAIKSLIEQQIAIKRLKDSLNVFSNEGNLMIESLNELYEKKARESSENHINLMLALYGIDGKFDPLTSVVKDTNGKLVDVSAMLDKIDGKLDKITDLLERIEDKLNKFSSQVR
jgi:hypothetical protein